MKKTVTATLTPGWALAIALRTGAPDRRRFALAVVEELTRQGIRMSAHIPRRAEPLTPYTKTTAPDGSVIIKQEQQ